MKFSLAINLERMDPSDDIASAANHTIEMVQMAEEAGFEIAWAAEHHAIEHEEANDYADADLQESFAVFTLHRAGSICR